MRLKKIIFLSLGILVGCCLSSAFSSEVIVYDEESVHTFLKDNPDSGNTSTASAAEKPAETGAETVVKAGGEVQKPVLTSGGTSMILEGTRMGDTTVSAPVTLSQTGVIMDFKTEPEGLGVALVRLEKTGEVQVLEGDSPDIFMRQELTPGVYKVYPKANLPGGGKAMVEKATVRMNIVNK